MKLGTRVSAHFLTGLAVILIGNSALLFVVARAYLVRQFEEQLQGALRTLVAAVEVEDDDVKWEPSDHTVSLGAEGDANSVRWAVLDERGKAVDRSANMRFTPEGGALFEPDQRKAWRESGWRFLQSELHAPHPKTPEERTPIEHAGLTVVVAGNEAEVTNVLQRLAIALILFPAICWGLSALAGRAYFGKVIAPVREMAKRAQEIGVDDPSSRLTVPPTQDELQDLGLAFNRLLDRLFTAYDLQQRFAGSAAHQLRTPLTILQGQVEVVLRRERTAAEYEQTLQLIRQEINAFSQTIEALVFLSRPSSDAAPADLQLVELREWLTKFLVQQAGTIGDRTVESYVEGELRCVTSPQLLNQVLQVLLSNALKYSSPGTPILLRAASDSEAVAIEVEDQGPGIAEQDRELIFQPFFRSAEARRRGVPGTGLGLAIAARIADVLGGKLTCESAQGSGSRFQLRLPRRV